MLSKSIVVFSHRLVNNLVGALLGLATTLEVKAYPLGLIANARKKASKCVGFVSDVSECQNGNKASDTCM